MAEGNLLAALHFQSAPQVAGGADKAGCHSRGMDNCWRSHAPDLAPLPQRRSRAILSVKARFEFGQTGCRGNQGEQQRSDPSRMH